MKNYIFSLSKNAFYPFELKASYDAAGTWPEDGIEVNDSVFIEFTGIPPDGKYRVVGADGLPEWREMPLPTQEELIAVADAKKLQLIDQANSYMNSKQWPGKAVMGRLSDAEKVRYNAWLDYLDELEAVDTSGAPDINWPESPEA